MTDVTQSFAARLLQARASGCPITPRPDELPQSEAAGYAVQHAVSLSLGPIGGWKVGAAGPEAPPNTAPLPAMGILPSPAVLGPNFTDRLVESEIAFRLAEDLPPRAQPYTRAEVIAAIGSCHPVIEVVQWRLQDYGAAAPFLKLADSIGHGALIVGEAIAGWQEWDFSSLRVTQEIEGQAAKTGLGNPAGDMIRLIAWLANEGAVWAGGLKAGQIVTCGSWTGATAAGPDAAVSVTFAGLPPVSAHFRAARP